MFIALFLCFVILPGVECTRGHNCDTNTKLPRAHFQRCKGSYTVKHGSILPISCIDGYETRDFKDVAVTCDNGTWVGIPKCVPKCSPLNLTKGMFTLFPKKLYFVGESTIVICGNGYFTHGAFPTTHIRVTCINTETWSLTNLECVKTENFTEVDKPQMEKYVFVHVRHPIALPCNLSKNNTLSNYTLIWIRNQHDITSRTLYTTSHYIVDYDGTLKISKFRPHLEGLYLCFARNANHMVLGDIYRVKKYHNCRRVQHTTRVKKLIGTPLLLMCPKYKPSKLVPVWYKDYQRLWNSGRVFLFVNGLMAVKSLHPSDCGTYTCKYYDEKSGCTKTYNTIVKVVTINHDDCGNSEGSHSTWAVSIWQQKRSKIPFCYGVLLSRWWILTAAKCFDAKNVNTSFELAELKVRVLKHEIHVGYDTFQVEAVEIHPNYSRTSNYADLALLHLKTAVSVEGGIKPICFIEGMSNRELRIQSNTTGFVDSWGQLSTFSLKSYPRRTITQTYPINTCMYDLCTVPKSLFCAKSTSNQTSQSGDVGAPFSVTFNGKYFLLGIYSWNANPDGTGQFDYYTDTSAFESWIILHTKGKKVEPEVVT